MGKIVSFMNNKGGVCKTITAFNIGVLWSRIGNKILFIDLDSQANLTAIVSDKDASDYEFEKTIEDAFILGPKVENALPILKSRYENIDYVPSSLKLSNFDSDTGNYEFKVYLLKDLLEKVKDQYDFIIIDCPPALGSIPMQAMVASDYIVLVTTADGPSVEGLNMMIELYNKTLRDQRLNPALILAGVIIAKIKKDNLHKNYIKVIENNFKDYVLQPYIRENTKLNTAESLHQDIYTFDPDGKAATEYMELAKELYFRIEK